MTKIKLNGEFTPKELHKIMKEHKDKLNKEPLFKIVDNSALYILNKYGKYKYVFWSNTTRELLLKNIRWIFEDILEIAGFKLPTFEEIADKNKSLYSLDVFVDRNDNYYFESESFENIISLKWWSKEANNYIKNNVLKDKVFQKWIENKFNKEVK